MDKVQAVVGTLCCDPACSVQGEGYYVATATTTLTSAQLSRREVEREERQIDQRTTPGRDPTVE